MNLDKIFGNKVVQNMLFGKLKTWAVENKVRSVMLPLSETGELGEPSFYTDETITITRVEYSKLIINQKPIT